jgi:hypothetical protein
MVEDSATLPSSNSRDLNTPLTTLPPLMVRYAFRAGESGLDLSRAENLSSMVVADGEDREPFLPPSPELAHADGDFIIADLLADDVIRWADICHPASVEPPAPRSGSVHFRRGTSCFSGPKTFQCD